MHTLKIPYNEFHSIPFVVRIVFATLEMLLRHIEREKENERERKRELSTTYTQNVTSPKPAKSIQNEVKL